jgi:hypothetical protein
LRSFPLARGDWSRARSSSCVSTSLPVPESSGCPGVPVLWLGWSFGAPLQPVEPFSWFWAVAKTIVAISITAAKADVTSACIIASRRMYNGKRCGARKFHARVLYRHRQPIEGDEIGPGRSHIQDAVLDSAAGRRVASTLRLPQLLHRNRFTKAAIGVSLALPPAVSCSRPRRFWAFWKPVAKTTLQSYQHSGVPGCLLRNAQFGPCYLRQHRHVE